MKDKNEFFKPLAVRSAVLEKILEGRCAAVLGATGETYQAGMVLKVYPTDDVRLLSEPGASIEQGVLNGDVDLAEVVNLRVTHVQHVGEMIPVLSVLRELEEGEDAEERALMEVVDVPFMDLSTNVFRHTRLPAVLLREGGIPGEVVLVSKLMTDNVPEGTPFPDGTKIPVGFVISFVRMGVQVDAPAMLDFANLKVVKRPVDGVPLSPEDQKAVMDGTYKPG